MQYEIKNELIDDVCKISLSGRLNIYAAHSLKEKLIPLFNSHNKILFQLEKVLEVDSSIIQMFISLKKTARKRGKALKFTSHNKSILGFMDLYGLVGLFSDKIILSNMNKKEFNFKYGVNKLPRSIT